MFASAGLRPETTTRRSCRPAARARRRTRRRRCRRARRNAPASTRARPPSSSVAVAVAPVSPASSATVAVDLPAAGDALAPPARRRPRCRSGRKVDLRRRRDLARSGPATCARKHERAGGGERRCEHATPPGECTSRYVAERNSSPSSAALQPHLVDPLGSGPAVVVTELGRSAGAARRSANRRGQRVRPAGRRGRTVGERAPEARRSTRGRNPGPKHACSGFRRCRARDAELLRGADARS